MGDEVTPRGLADQYNFTSTLQMQSHQHTYNAVPRTHSHKASSVHPQPCVLNVVALCSLGIGNHQDVLGEGWITLDRYLWATAVLDSRMIWWDGRKHLVPLLDLVSLQILCHWYQ